MQKSSHLPKFSVVIPACNEATLLPLCLKSIYNQDYKGEFEVIVADNASSDATAEIAKSFGAKVVYEPARGVVYARIAGCAVATGDIIVSTDADTIVPENWLSMYQVEFCDKLVDGVVGAYRLWNLNTFSKKVVMAFVPLFRQVDRFFGAHFAGANFAVRRDAYVDVGGFSTDFQTGEDLDLSYRLRKHGYHLKVAYHICVKTSARRLNEGLYYTFMNYIVKNWFSLVFLHHPHLKKLTIVREETSEIEDNLSL